MKLIDKVKQHDFVKDGDKVGVISSFGKGAESIVKPDTRDIVVIANTGDIDLESEVVVPSGGDPTYFKANRQIFADHSYGIGDGVADLRDLKPYPSIEDHKSWRVRARVRKNEAGNAIMDIVKTTGQIGVSIGFIAKDYGPPTEDELAKYGDGNKTIRSIVRTWDWFELSFTLLPCNVSCQSLGSVEGKSLDMLNAVDRLVTKGVIRRDIAHMLGMPIAPKRKMHKVALPTEMFVVPSSYAV